MFILYLIAFQVGTNSVNIAYVSKKKDFKEVWFCVA